MRYRARNGFHINNKDAQIIGESLEALSKNGPVTPERVLLSARDKNNKLHRYFEWNDKIAAEKYRLEQARYFIKAIVTEVDGEQIPAFHLITVKGDDQYKNINELLETPDLWDQVLHRALKEAQDWSERYKRYTELNRIHVSITKTKEKIDGEQEKDSGSRRRRNTKNRAKKGKDKNRRPVTTAR